MALKSLKTLKEIPSGPNEEDYTDHSRYYRDIILKQNIIEDIKMIENIESSGLSEKEKSFLISIFDFKLIKYLKWKFNISKEDLQWESPF